MSFTLSGSNTWRAWVLRDPENLGVNICLRSCLQCPALVTNQGSDHLMRESGLCFLLKNFLVLSCEDLYSLVYKMAPAF